MIRFLALALLFVSSSVIAKSAAADQKMPHLDLEMSSTELQKVYDQTRWSIFDDAQKRLDAPVRAGKRNLDWLNFINSTRPEKISFSDPKKPRGIPMDKPSEYNEEIAYKKYTDLVEQMPKEMKKVIIDGEAFTADPGIPVEDYIEWGDKIDRAYQTAIRWMMMEPYLGYLAQRRYQDIRGYYFILNYPNRDEVLATLDTLPTDEREKFVGWLAGVCMNGGTDATICTNEARKAVNGKSAKAFWDKYKTTSRNLWNNFHNIGTTNYGVEWTQANPNVTRVPFRIQSTTDMTRFLKHNLEEEWQWNDWKLKVYFDSAPAYAIEVIWQPGITPHVPGLGSSQIYMDSNAPLTEWDVQWTIRHEFGHNLGFPDCYVEFYDSDRKVIINYQLDITDLMCSRSGRLKARHFTEMKRAYLR